MNKLFQVLVAVLVIMLLTAICAKAAPPGPTSPPQVTIQKIWVIQNWTYNGQPVIVQETIQPVTTRGSCTGPQCSGPATCPAGGQCRNCPTCTVAQASIPKPVQYVSPQPQPVSYNSNCPNGVCPQVQTQVRTPVTIQVAPASYNSNCPNGTCSQAPTNTLRSTFLLPGKK